MSMLGKFYEELASCHLGGPAFALTIQVGRGILGDTYTQIHVLVKAV